MRVSTIELRNFTCHTAATLRIPETGLVLLTGSNGVGKSSFLEAVSVGLWGKSLRGASPWQTNNQGSVSICGVADGADVSVLRATTAKGKISLEFDVAGEKASYPTVTKAQDVLTSLFGSWEVWRRANVFSSAEMAHFTLSTDAERKNLLESILGLKRFDAALALCRTDLAAAKVRLDEAAQALARAVHAREWVARFKEVREAEWTELETVRAGLADVSEKEGELAALAAHIGELQSKLDGEVAAAELQLDQALKTARDMHTEKCGKCPTCGQPLESRELREALATQQRAVREQHSIDTAARFFGVRADLQNARGKHDVEFRNLLELKGKRVAYENAARAWDKRNQEATALEAQAQDRENAAKVALDDSRTEVEILESVENVLGLRGVRSMLLAKALGGIEDVANYWLSQMTGRDLRLELRPYTEKADGGMVDSISLDVLGAGGGYGYKAASQGERRRIDVALLLALSEVSSAATGKPPGVLWVDEAFDALDEDGTDAIVAILGTLAKTRPVVVISHSDLLVAKLPKAERVHLT